MHKEEGATLLYLITVWMEQTTLLMLLAAADGGHSLLYALEQWNTRSDTRSRVVNVDPRMNKYALTFD